MFCTLISLDGPGKYWSRSEPACTDHPQDRSIPGNFRSHIVQILDMNEDKAAIHTAEAPAAIGPYSQAIRIGNLVYTSGQVAIDPATGQLVTGGIEAQTHRVLQNLQAVLAASGLDLSRVIKTTVFLKNMADFSAMNSIYSEYLQTKSGPAPARSTVEVARLPKDALVEIEAIAG
jgi:2-iminobutanoate/2-iminopropanoate deaminase